MSRNNNNNKIDRQHQMETQKEIIERKKLEILEKQKNAQLVKAIMKTIKPDVTVETTGGSNPVIFSNDGSFLEKFKEMAENAKSKIDSKSTATSSSVASEEPSSSRVDQANRVSDQNLRGFPAPDQHPSQGAYLDQSAQSVIGYISKNQLPPLSLISTAFPIFNPNIPPPLSSLSDHPVMQQHQQQQNRFLPPLSTIATVPKSNVLLTSNESDLNVDQNKMPEMEAIGAATSQQNKVFSDNELMMPTSIEQLIELVADIGDIYEEKLLSRKNELHASIWFLANKSSPQYKNYRHLLADRRIHLTEVAQPSSKDGSTKYDPADVLENDEDNQFEVKEKITRPNIDDETSSDSDTEYMKEAKERNLRNIKRKAADSHLRRNDHDTSDSEEEDYDMQRKSFFHGKRDSEVSSDSQSKTNRTRLKRSRWGEKIDVPPPVIAASVQCPNTQSPLTTPTVVMPLQAPNNQIKLTKVTRGDPALMAYARQNFGTIDLTEEDWLKAEEHYKINLLYQDLLKKRQEIDRLAKSGKFKFEYDSDEDTTGGTWEHKLRMQEMEATKNWADALNKQSDGKHFLGDFLPPEELKKFMEQYEAKKNNRLPDLSDYREFKLKDDNIGFQMLQKLGWQEGQGLGAGGSGIVEPINKASQRQNHGLGTSTADVPEQNDNEYDAYRKRMMLAYRFRPNPLNNPRRAYY